MGCTWEDRNSAFDYYGSHPAPSTFYTPQFEEQYYYSPYASEKKEVRVPNTYHVGQFHAPESHKRRDVSWVESQSPNHYTLSLSEDSKAANVASVLYQAPKKEHMAEVQYGSGDQKKYQGLYGSYPSKEEAEKAYNSLPQEIKNGARIKQFNEVQAQLR